MVLVRLCPLLLALTLAACHADPSPLAPAALCSGRALSITHDERARGLTLVRAVYSIDGVTTYSRTVPEGLPAPLPIFEGSVPPGRHSLTFLLAEQDGDRRIVVRGSLPFNLAPEARLVLVVETRGDGDAVLHGRTPPVVVHTHGCAPGARSEADRTPEDLSIRLE